MKAAARIGTPARSVRPYDLGIYLLVGLLAMALQSGPLSAAPNATASAASSGGEPAAALETSEAAPRAGTEAQSRLFRFDYRFAISGVEAGKALRVWLPLPASSPVQQITPLAARLPAPATIHEDPIYGNRILYLEAAMPAQGPMRFDVPYRIRRREIVPPPQGGSPFDRKLDAHSRQVFLQANAYVPTDGKPLELLRGMALGKSPYTQARQLYDLVDRYVSYKKVGSGWGHGDVRWVCDSRYGNCTDFHSLFISLARSQGIPARFEIGFSIPGTGLRGAVDGYHCWALFYTPAHGWLPVDISEADKRPSLKEYYFGGLTADRVAFSVGRDIRLVPKGAHGPLNFFIYPHVEMDGKTLPRERLMLQFAYSDLPE